MKLVTISFDDGGAGDARVVQLLDDAGIRGTFYLSTGHLAESFYEGRTKDEIIALYEKHEVGGHGHTHVSARELADEPGSGDWVNEIYRPREVLQNLFQQDIKCYAYPYGHYTERARDAVGLAKFAYARTCVRGEDEKVATCSDRLRIPITCIVREEGDESLLINAMEAELPIHVVTHPWEVSAKHFHKTIARILLGLKEMGYEFRDNYGFFREVLR